MANHHAAVLPLALDFGPDLQVQCTRSSSCLRSPRDRADTQPQRQSKPLNAEPLGTPKRPTGGGASTWRSALCSGTGCSAAPKRLISGGRTSPSRPPAPGEISSRCAARRPTSRPWSSGSLTDRSAGGSAPRRSTPAWGRLLRTQQPYWHGPADGGRRGRRPRRSSTKGDGSTGTWSPATLGARPQARRLSG